MADNLKLTVRALYSKNTDYSSPKVDFNPDAYTLTPDEYMHFEVNCDDNGETFDTSMFSGGVSLLVIKNNDTTITVTARIDTAATANVDVAIPAGGMFITPDFNISEDIVLTSASGTPECEVFIVGT
jgi:hypothetical protein